MDMEQWFTENQDRHVTLWLRGPPTKGEQGEQLRWLESGEVHKAADDFVTLRVGTDAQQTDILIYVPYSAIGSWKAT